MEIIAAMDIMDGKCVRLTQGDFGKKTVYPLKPLDQARLLEDHGIRRLHLVDLDGALAGRVVNWKVLERVVSGTSLQVDFGGGIKTGQDLETVFSCGAPVATIGSVAILDPPLFSSWVKKYGPGRLLVGADIRSGKIAVSGWTRDCETGVVEFIRSLLGEGIRKVFCTDIGSDGLMKGPAFSLYAEILAEFPGLDLIASGGISEIEDLYRLMEIGCSGAIIGKSIYEGRIPLRDLRPFLDA